MNETEERGMIIQGLARSGAPLFLFDQALLAFSMAPLQPDELALVSRIIEENHAQILLNRAVSGNRPLL